MKSAEEIVKPHLEILKKINYKNQQKTFSPTIQLFMKWAYRVEKGWYGFDLEGVPNLE